MQIATTLLNYGAETNILTKQGVTPLHLASQGGHADMVTLLLEKGSNIHVATKVTQLETKCYLWQEYRGKYKTQCGNEVILSVIVYFTSLYAYL